MASKTQLPYRRVAIVVATIAIGAIAARALYQQFAESITPPPAPTQMEKLVARLDVRADCDRFRAKLLAQAGAGATSGATQYAIAEAWQGASRAGCIAA